MGSLVVSAGVSDFGQYNTHPHHPIMVGSVSQQHVATDQSANTCTNSEQAPTSTVAFPPPTTCSARLLSGRAGSDQIPRDPPAATTSAPSTQEPNGLAQSSSQTSTPVQAAGRAQLVSHPSQHAHGLDQSGFPLNSTPRALAASSPASPRLLPTYRSARSLGGSEGSSPSRIKVRNLSHIQSFASEELLTRPRIAHQLGSRFYDPSRQYEISAMPVTDIIEMVAGLLTKITTTNDRQYEHLHKPISPSEDGAPLTSQTTSVLAFHGKNVPTITILSYLSRIHKYCPTTYEVFLSLLVYFDRMTEAVNRGFLHSMRRDVAQIPAMPSNPARSSPSTAVDMEQPSAKGSSLAPASLVSRDFATHAVSKSGGESSQGGRSDLSRFFVVDSYNIHRLVIAGVTCASKFFSDVFYTNSRYAKVGGLPLTELNHLELQFLLLNDFRLSVPVEELEAYGTMLVEFYAREVVIQQQLLATHGGTEGVCMQDQLAAPYSAQAATPS